MARWQYDRAALPPWLVALALVWPRGPLPAAEPAARPSAAGVAFYAKEVEPLLKAHCLNCHGGGDKVKGGLKLTSRADVLQGGDAGPVVALDRPETSLLLRAVHYASDDLKMPPKGKLTPPQIEVLAKWVRMGVPFVEPKVAAHHGPPPVDEAARGFWSFRPVARPAVPESPNSKFQIRNPIDAFVLAKLQAAWLQPAPPASRTSLLRRVYYDLIGLPPAPADVDAFLADTAPDAYEKVVERLLASPHYGERWARHWLDLVRYAETGGYEVDAPKPNAWRYRDYVIQSFNADKPYDRFVREQLAGDELDPVTTDGLIATGYYQLAPFDGGAPDKLQAQYDGLDDIVATTGQVFLGLTVNCARCHDHKIDPFPQADYYRLLAFFHNVRVGGRGSQRPIAAEVGPDVQQAEVAQYQQRLADLRKSIQAFEDALRPHLVGGEADDFKTPDYRVDIARKHVPEHVAQQDFEYYSDRVRQLAQMQRTRPRALAQALCVSENGRTPPDTFILLRGNPRSKGDRVGPGFPSALTTRPPVFPPPGPDASSCGRRKVLADGIASPDNPLTARVLVNRVWQHHFGRGIVRSSSDFGFHGTPPTHPELLDWLASEFVAPASGGREAPGSPTPGWTLKRLHRLIVLSSTYQMSSAPDPSALTRDPENDLFSRFDLRRLGAEEVRDSILAVCGNINLSKLGGPSVFPRISAEVFAGQSRPGSGWGQSSAADQARRSVYVHVKRSLTLPLHAAFDAADPDATCPARFTTTVPTQALAMLNGEFLHEQARVFADDVRRRAGDDPAAQVRLTLRRVVQRDPTAREVERGVAFLARLRGAHKLPPGEALARYCLLALNLNEFVYVD
jgi:mono/diheme cytochrome c family protein